MHRHKKEYSGYEKEKREMIVMVVEKPEGILHRCANTECRKPIIQGTLIAGNLSLQCPHCGTMNKLTPVIKTPE